MTDWEKYEDDCLKLHPLRVWMISAFELEELTGHEFRPGFYPEDSEKTGRKLIDGLIDQKYIKHGDYFVYWEQQL